MIGTRNMKKALLRALLEPTAQLRQLENDGDYTARLALLEEQKSLPWQAIWEMYCQRHDTPAGSQWLDSVRAYRECGSEPARVMHELPGSRLTPYPGYEPVARISRLRRNPGARTYLG